MSRIKLTIILMKYTIYLLFKWIGTNIFTSSLVASQLMPIMYSGSEDGNIRIIDLRLNGMTVLLKR